MLGQEGRGALVTYVTAADPDVDTCRALLQGLPAAGADVVELGLPFSDPMADGPSIQRASQRALKAGGSARQTLALARAFREQDAETPLVVMGYYNPILSYGIDRFAADAAAAGVDGLITVDLPPEEDETLRLAAAGRDLRVIRLATPTTDNRRLPAVLSDVGGFVYYVAIAGITGTRSAEAVDLAPAVARLKAHTDLPVAVGFGVRTPDQAAAIARFADGAVVGSAIVDKIAEALDEAGRPLPGLVPSVLGFVGSLAAAVRGARQG
jgi:tryptophan synthase alpha chain